MGAAAALLWRRRLAMSGGVAPQELLGSPRWPPWMGTAAAGRRTDGGRWPEATRGVIRHSPQLGGCHLANKARRAFVLRGHSFAFTRQSGVCGSGWRTNGARSYKRQYAQTCDLRYFETPRSVVADSASFPAHHSWGLVFACQSVARSHPAFAKGSWT
jgi:hypothetical protein